jgi:hypothetical protein
VASTAKELKAAGERLRQTFELIAVAEAMLRQRLEREHPRWAATTVEREVLRWRLERPGAEFGDAPGRLRRLPARRSSPR